MACSACPEQAAGRAAVGADAEPHYDRALRLYDDAEYRAAFDAFGIATATGNAALAVRARKGRVRAALRMAEYGLARREADALMVTAAGESDAVALNGDALWSVGLFDDADQQYVRALTLDQRSPRALFGIARSLASRSRLAEALDRAKAALTIAPHESDLHALTASIYERLNRFEPAAAAYDAYARRLPRGEPTPAAIANSRAEFLRSFADREPLAMSESDAALYTVPFRLVRNKILMSGRVNGLPVDWVLDTGAERTGISTGLAERAGVRRVTTTMTAGVGPPALRRVVLGRADRLEVGRLRIRNVPVSIRNPAAGGAPRWQGESLSPVALGLSVVIDYPRRRVTFGRSLQQAEAASPDMAASVRLPMRVYRLPLVAGTLNGVHVAPFVVDTGGEVISISIETAAALAMRPSRRIPLRVFGLSGLDEQAFLLPGVDVAFDQIAYPNTGVAVLNLRAPSVLLGFQLGGIIGHRLLGEYRVSIDVEKSELRLEK